MLLFAVSASGAPGDATAKTYIVQMLQAPVVAYEGDVAGLAATKPAKGQKIDPNSAAVKKYAAHLVGQHDAVLQKVGGAAKVYSYTYSYNGFAAKLTDGQKAALAKQEGVLAVTEEELVTGDTSSTPEFLGLTADGGLWEQLGGPTGGKKGVGAGEDVVIGIVDSGIWPESGSFSDRDAKGKLIYQQIPGWHGKCTPGEEFSGSDCNQKLIGAQYFNASWGGDAALEAERPWEFMSPRDYNGHGTHTASTSGGNYNVATTGPATVFGPVSGIAPRARIAAYKALWSTQDAATASGFTGDLVAAIDQAVADGVDVINYSISGSRTNFADPVMISFLFAADAGIFVAASAGNSGPASSTVAHPSPWMTTVAAGTHNRDGRGSVTLGNGATYTGASVATPVGPAPLVDSVNVGKAGADATEVALCYPGTLDPAKVTGKIVLCLRGVIARVDKSLAVQQAGGIGMVLYNDPDSSLNADFHFVPTVHVDKASGLAIKAYIAGTANPTATINASEIVFNAVAPLTASFSSRGPLLAGGGDMLKPDVIAPGQDILAAVAPPGNAGRDFNLYSGTSMSSPHVAGLAALLMHKHPGWSPMAVKSALMTTGYDVLDGGTPAPNTNPVLIFRQGAGHVQPNKAADPGLVYDSSWNDWLAFLCGTTSAVNPASCTALKNAGYSTDASDMNVASIAIGDLAGVQTVTRKVTNVGSSPATYNASVTGMAGFNTVVSPSSLTLNPGETKSFTVSFTRTTATLNAYTGGQLAWSDGTHTVRSPIVVRPVALAAPAQVTGTGGPISYGITFGYDGPFSATARGLVPAVTEARTVLDDPTDSTCSLSSPNAQIHTVAVAAGTTYARFSLFDAFTDGNDDLDLCVFNAAGTNVGSSGTGTSAEEVNLVNPAAGDYRVVVQGWGTDGPDAQYTLFRWLLGSTAAGNMTVTAPTTATTGGTGTVELAFSGLAPATKYLGSVAYAGVAGLPNPTIVRVDTP
ncbi:MAG TPA: S8 family peptidase [Gaiellaceae bacterium]|nr:S8 family peptidase [Gaiellaceae bacterium]